jgi:putative hydrolase of the HAD superfamily
MTIKNVVFDVGNVLVRWSPMEVISSVFPEFEVCDFCEKMRPIWLDLNRGKLSEEEAIDHYQDLFNVPRERFARLLRELLHHQQPIDGSIALLEELQAHNVNLFSITDNTKEFMEYHRKHSAFPKYFTDIIVSADLGILKPDPRIYIHLLKKHGLNASESVFIDDLEINVEGAINVGMKAFQFTDSASSKKQLMDLLLIPYHHQLHLV